MSTKGDYKGQFICSADARCPDGQWCFNGFCAPGCMSDNDCAQNQYCDTRFNPDQGDLASHLCVNKTVSGCSNDDQCSEGQKCVMGLCSAAAEPTQCTPRVDGQDGCDSYSICLDISETEQEQYSCVSFPPCPQNGICPVGQMGSVCNDDDIPGKEAICLTSLCKTKDNCPGVFKCVLMSATLGMCSDGSMGMPCKTKTDCNQSLDCSGALTGGPGFCIPSIGGESCTDAGGTCISVTTPDCPSGTDVDSSLQCSSMMEVCCK
jgi:hypothetical protein